MKLKTSLLALIALSLTLEFVIACSPSSTAPTVSAATAAPAPPTPTASPTDTPIPPTETPSPTDTPTTTPTDTPTTTPTDTLTATPTDTLTPTTTPTATRTATRKPTPRPTNTLATITSAMLLKSRGSGHVTVINNYTSALILTVADKTYTVPAGATDFPIDVGPGNYIWTVVIPGVAKGTGGLIVMSGWDTVLAFGRRS